MDEFAISRPPESTTLNDALGRPPSRRKRPRDGKRPAPAPAGETAGGEEPGTTPTPHLDVVA